MLNMIKEKIEEEMIKYAEKLQDELVEKYNKEFAREMSAYRNTLVLNAISLMKLEMQDDKLNGVTNIRITL